MNPQNVDLLVTNAYIATMDSDRRIITNGTIAIRNGIIVSVGLHQKVSAKFNANQTIDAKGALVHPGFIDTHIHLLYHNIRWGNEDGVGWDTGALPLHGEYGQFVNQTQLNPINTDSDSEEFTSVSVQLASLEMALNGTTCFLEAGGVGNSDLAADAINSIGIRGLLGGPFVQDNKEGATEHDRDMAFQNLGSELKRNSDPNALVRGVVTVSGMGNTSDEILIEAKSMADEHGVILNMHQSYQTSDAIADDARLGKHPLVHYAEIDVLGNNCTFSHVNIVRDDEIEPIINSGMSIAWCPMASMLYGVGGTIQGRHLELYKQGVNIAFGCDSANWTSAFDIGEQAFIALLTAREKTQEPNALIAEDVLEMATLNGAKSVRMDDRLGSIEVGKKADIVIRKMNLPEAFPDLDPIRSVMFSSRSKSIDTVIVDGHVIVKGSHSTLIDEEELFARSHEISHKLFKRLKRPLPSGPWPRIYNQ